MTAATISLFISGPEIFFIMVIVLMLFGADKIPEIARSLGKGMRQLRDATNEIKHEITKSAEESGVDTSQLTGEVQKEIDKVKEDIDEITGPIKRQR